MVQLQRTVEDSIPPPQGVVVVKAEVVDKRFHRVTVEWSLNGQPVPEWIEAFNRAVLAAGGFHRHVPSAYGRPMVMHDKTIVWAMFEADVQKAASFVDQAVARTNSQFDSLLDPVSEG